MNKNNPDDAHRLSNILVSNGNREYNNMAEYEDRHLRIRREGFKVRIWLQC